MAPLAPLQPLAPLPAPSSSGGAGNAILSGIGEAALDVALPGSSAIFGVSASRLIAIIVGLIVIAAAVFSFKPVRETVVGVSKIAAKAAVA